MFPWQQSCIRVPGFPGSCEESLKTFSECGRQNSLQQLIDALVNWGNSAAVRSTLLIGQMAAVIHYCIRLFVQRAACHRPLLFNHHFSSVCFLQLAPPSWLCQNSWLCFSNDVRRADSAFWTDCLLDKKRDLNSTLSSIFRIKLQQNYLCTASTYKPFY